MPDDHGGEFGAISLPALRRIRTLWLDIEPLVSDTRYDSPVAPAELQVDLADGIGDADAARLDIRWSERGMYAFHYAGSDGIDWRFDRHPNPHSPTAHFHPPPAATAADAEPSCLAVQEVSLVTRAVHAAWRAAYDHDDLDRLNSASNPP
jgi:hypothetical protein